ncbi:hypothetical protein GOODEAATRI_024202 [Goodea atripinnis]|uniref:Uncharacterized protein n=1 Tax=Goodea atripinnis TaxID=208336 RepID=A0ABV0NMV5_9TELE
MVKYEDWTENKLKKTAKVQRKTLKDLHKAASISKYSKKALILERKVRRTENLLNRTVNVYVQIFANKLRFLMSSHFLWGVQCSNYSLINERNVFCSLSETNSPSISTSLLFVISRKPPIRDKQPQWLV